ncbi:MAG: hypothetical protein ACTSXE_02620 [Candidatus Thorarchaeota archaeon]
MVLPLIEPSWLFLFTIAWNERIAFTIQPESDKDSWSAPDLGSGKHTL